MSPYVIAYLTISAISVIAYATVAYSNWVLSKTLESINGSGVYIVRVLAVLSLIVLLEDLFWIIVLVLPRIIGESARSEGMLLALIILNVVLRSVPIVALFRMRRKMFIRRKAEKEEAELHGKE